MSTRRAVPTHKAPPPSADAIARAKGQILAALLTAGPHGSWGGDLREAVISATITPRVYEVARKQLGHDGLVVMVGQRTSLTDAGRVAAAERRAA